MQAATFPKLALRDAAIVAGVAALWWSLAGLTARSGMLADLVGLLVGLAIGAAVYLLHEWGHALAGLAAGGVVHPARSFGAISLFAFDARRNTRRQFVIMSLGGFAVTAAAVTFVYTLLPDALLATRVARGAVLVLAALAVFLELPILLIGVVRGRIPEAVQVFEGPEPVAATAEPEARPVALVR